MISVLQSEFADGQPMQFLLMTARLTGLRIDAGYGASEREQCLEFSSTLIRWHRQSTTDCALTVSTVTLQLYTAAHGVPMGQICGRYLERKNKKRT